ncbi:MAG: hypothetical protein AAF846_01105 [Chloroflexota bacterium]
MSHTITISDALYTKAQHLAQARSQSVDDVIHSLLDNLLDQPRLGLPKDERDELDALAYLTDATLFTIAREQMPSTKQVRMESLMQINTRGNLSNVESQELTQLVDDSQRLTLRKAEALKLLIERGYKVNLDTLSTDE